MISFIVPPLIIVLSIGVIIILLARRTQDVDFTAVPEKKKKETPLSTLKDEPSSTKATSGKLSSSFSSLKKSSRAIFKSKKKSPIMATTIPEEATISKGTQDEIDKSTMTFVRRRLMLQEQQRHSTNHGGDVEATREGKKFFSEQEADLVRRIADHPHDIDAYEQLGDYYLTHKNYNEAHQCFKQILKMQPRNRRAQMIMKRFARDLEKREKENKREDRTD